jgi:hypothetical protein
MTSLSSAWRFDVTARRPGLAGWLAAAFAVVWVGSLAPGCDDGPTGDGGPAGDADVDGSSDGDVSECELVEDPVTRPELPGRPAEVDYLVIAQDRLERVAEDHAAYRDERGHRSEVLSMSEATEDGEGGYITDHGVMIEHLRDLVRERREALDPDRTLFVLLLGPGSGRWSGSIYSVPADEVGDWQWTDGSPVTSDTSIADLDGDHVPDVAVGRIPAQDADDADPVLERTRELEQAYDVGQWNYLVNVFASEAGFGDIIDEMIEQAGFDAVREVPTEWAFSFTYARFTSPYAYPPALFSDRVYDLLNDGSFMNIYIGHGWEGGFDDVLWGDERAPILDTEDLDQLDISHRSSLLLLAACLTGAFDADENLAGAFLLQSGGPVAIVASTELSHPYANGVLLREIAQAGLVTRHRTVGEVVLDAKRRMVDNADDDVRQMLDTYAVVDPTSATAELREDLILQHEHAYVLFGDPAHEVQYPAGTIDVQVESDEVVSGEDVRACVQVHGPPAGHAIVTLETDRETIGQELAEVALDDPDRDDVVVANNAAANDKVIERWEGDYEGGGFSVAFPTSAGRTGRLTVRVYATSGDLDALGSAEVLVRSPED